MATYFMFGSYSQESITKISANRTDKMKKLIEKQGGKLAAAYALLGEKDVVLIVDLPSVEQAMKTSVALSRMLGIGFTTCPAVTIEAFDKLATDLQHSGWAATQDTAGLRPSERSALFAILDEWIRRRMRDPMSAA